LSGSDHSPVIGAYQVNAAPLAAINTPLLVFNQVCLGGAGARPGAPGIGGGVPVQWKSGGMHLTWTNKELTVTGAWPAPNAMGTPAFRDGKGVLANVAVAAGWTVDVTNGWQNAMQSPDGFEIKWLNNNAVQHRLKYRDPGNGDKYDNVRRFVQWGLCLPSDNGAAPIGLIPWLAAGTAAEQAAKRTFVLF